MALDIPVRRHARFSRWIWLAVWVAMFIGTHRPLSPGVAAAISGYDKIIHFAIYLLLTVLGGWHARSIGRPLSVGWMLGWAAVYACYGAVDELTQPYVERTASLGDWAADLAGITVGMLLLAVWRPRGSGLDAGDVPDADNVTPD
jgi:hypothetical protein